jgi:hypothetical protein
MKTSFFKVKRLGLAALAALALVVMGCENPAVWDGDAESRSVTAGPAVITPVDIDGTLNTAIDPVAVHIAVSGDEFIVNIGADASGWFSNLPAGLIATVSNIGGDGNDTVTITVSGTPTEISSFWIRGEIPGTALDSGVSSPISTTAYASYNIRWPYPSWDHTTVFSNGAVNCATYGEGLFVVGNRRAGEVAISPDNGRTWDIVFLWNAGDKDWVSSLAYINGTFYAGGNYGMLASSPDGQTWQVIGQKLLNAEDIRTIAYGNGVTVIGGTNGQATYTPGYPSSTSTWRAITGFDPAYTGTFNSIAFGENTGIGPLFVVTGQGALSGYSRDGIKWIDTTDQTDDIFPPSGSQSSIKMVAYDPNNRKFVIVGFHQAAYVVPDSSNGFTWVGVDLTDIMGSTNRTSWLNCVIFAEKYFIAGGSGGQTISSLDGINWAITGVQGQFPLPGSDIPFANAIAYNGNAAAPVYLIGGGFDDGPAITAFNVTRTKKPGKEDPQVIVK